jgi:hypothetical protein
MPLGISLLKGLLLRKKLKSNGVLENHSIRNLPPLGKPRNGDEDGET